MSEAKRWIDFEHPELSVREQCRLLGLHRSNVYYDPVPESEENLRLMRMMDEEHLRRPCRGSRQMVDFLLDEGLVANRKKVQRLMRRMGIEGISPQRRTTLRRTATNKHTTTTNVFCARIQPWLSMRQAVVIW